MSSLQYYWILNIISYSLHWFHHQQFFGHNDMVMFFFPLSFFAFLVCFSGISLLEAFSTLIFPILGDFMRYLVRILVGLVLDNSFHSCLLFKVLIVLFFLRSSFDSIHFVLIYLATIFWEAAECQSILGWGVAWKLFKGCLIIVDVKVNSSNRVW